MKKRTLLVGLVVLCFLTILAYVAIPSIAANWLESKLLENQSNSVVSVSISWGGPQTISGLHIEDSFGTADIDVEINNSLVSLISLPAQIKATVSGDAVIDFSTTTDNSVHQTGVVVEKSQPSATPTFPPIRLDVILGSLMFDGEEPMMYTNVEGTLDVNPGHHFSASMTATTDLGGTINASCTASDLVDKTGILNWNSSGTLSFSIIQASLPTFNGVGGWSVIEMDGEISSPNLTESATVFITGSLAEYETARGSILVKTQLTNPVKDGSFEFNEQGLVGSIEVIDVPTTLLSTLLRPVGINTIRDIGPTMNVGVQRSVEGSPMRVSIQTKELVATGVVDSDRGIITDVDITAHIKDELLQLISEEDISGEATVELHLDRLVPAGVAEDTLIGTVSINGNLHYKPSNLTITTLNSSIAADVLNRYMSANGTAVLNNQPSSFIINLHPANKDKLDGIDDLWKSTSSQLPRGSGEMSIKNISTSLLLPYINFDGIDLDRDVGPTINVNSTLQQDKLFVSIENKKLKGSGTILFKGNEVAGFNDIDLHTAITKELATNLAQVQFGSNVELRATIKHMYMNLDSSYELSLVIGKQHTVIRGTTDRIAIGEDSGNLNLHLTATGIDTRLLDAICSYNGLLVDSVGSPMSVDLRVDNLIDAPVVTASGTSPSAAFKTFLSFFDGKMFTIPNKPTLGELVLSQSLTQHLLKDLGPVLSDIRSIKHPIQMTVTDAAISLDGDLSELDADILIDIGEVSLDSGSVTMKILPIFNTKHIETVPAFFDPIHIEIRKGIATYKEFNVTVANKYSIPYSGTINLITRQLNLKSVVPLTSLGYSIKELRGLATDIDVPVLITGSIDNPKVSIDPNFDLGKILQSTAINAIGDALDSVLSGGDNKPDPLKLLEDLLNK